MAVWRVVHLAGHLAEYLVDQRAAEKVGRLVAS